MVEVVEKFYRQELFDHYNSCTNPFIITTSKIDITKVVEYCKVHRKFYATLGYFITQTVNQIENFKYRYDENGKIYYCNQIRSNYTQMKKDDDIIGYYDIPVIGDFEEYIKELKINFLKEIIIFPILVLTKYGFHVNLGFNLLVLYLFLAKKYQSHNSFGTNMRI